jgi:hypothetical protein
MLCRSTTANASGLGMIRTQWRDRLIYLAMSAFVTWHTLAMVIAPAPDNSVIVQSLRGLFQPYLTLFRLDNLWDFFAPTVGKGSQFRYIIEDADGQRRTFVPAEYLSWFHPSYFWFRSLYYAIVDDPELYADSAAALLCRKHASLHPVAVTLLRYDEGDFSPEDHLSGKHPMDPEFVTVNTLKRVECTDS